MSLWRQLTRGLRVLTNRSAADQDVADEVQHYLEQATAAHVARGLSPEEARRAARLELGSVTSVSEQVRDYGWENVVDTLLADLRYAARRLRSDAGLHRGHRAHAGARHRRHDRDLQRGQPDPVRAAAVPGRRPDRDDLGDRAATGRAADGTFGMYRELAERSRSFEAIAVLKPWQPTMTGRGPSRSDSTDSASAPSYFRVLGVAPTLGRDFAAVRRSAQRARTSSSSATRSGAGASAAIPRSSGAQITLDDNSYHGHRRHAARLRERARARRPSCGRRCSTTCRRDGRGVITCARSGGCGRASSVDRGDAGARCARRSAVLDGAASGVVRRRNTRSSSTSLQDDVTRGVKPALLAILGAVVAGARDRVRERDEPAARARRRSGAASSRCAPRSAPGAAG